MELPVVVLQNVHYKLFGNTLKRLWFYQYVYNRLKTLTVTVLCPCPPAAGASAHLLFVCRQMTDLSRCSVIFSRGEPWPHQGHTANGPINTNTINPTGVKEFGIPAPGYSMLVWKSQKQAWLATLRNWNWDIQL